LPNPSNWNKLRKGIPYMPFLPIQSIGTIVGIPFKRELETKYSAPYKRPRRRSL